MQNSKCTFVGFGFLWVSLGLFYCGFTPDVQEKFSRTRSAVNKPVVSSGGNFCGFCVPPPGDVSPSAVYFGAGDAEVTVPAGGAPVRLSHLPHRTDVPNFCPLLWGGRWHLRGPRCHCRRLPPSPVPPQGALGSEQLLRLPVASPNWSQQEASSPYKGTLGGSPAPLGFFFSFTFYFSKGFCAKNTKGFTAGETPWC